MILATIILLFWSFLRGQAVLVNRTFDDAYAGSDIITFSYVPKEAWLACPGCGGRATPDSKRVFASTWHDTTQDTNIDRVQALIDITFVGQAIYVYCAIANHLKDPNVGTKADYTFYLDNELQPQRFIHTKDNETDIEFYYDIPVFSKTNLDQTTHTLKIIPNGAPGVEGSTLLLFDYAVISVDEGLLSPTSTLFTQSASPSELPVTASPSSDASLVHKKHTRAIVGGVLGSVAAVVALLSLLFFLDRRRSRPQALQPLQITGSTSILQCSSDHASSSRVGRWLSQQQANPTGRTLGSLEIGQQASNNRVSNVLVERRHSEMDQIRHHDPRDRVSMQPSTWTTPSDIDAYAPSVMSGSIGSRTIAEIRDLRREVAELKQKILNYNRRTTSNTVPVDTTTPS